MKHLFQPTVDAMQSTMSELATNIEAVRSLIANPNYCKPDSESQLQRYSHAYDALEAAVTALNVGIINRERDAAFDKACRLADHCASLQDI